MAEARFEVYDENGNVIFTTANRILRILTVPDQPSQELIAGSVFVPTRSGETATVTTSGVVSYNTSDMTSSEMSRPRASVIMY